mmetsp:Transcript_26872/g.30206  ORF Transcript_26872/g.30206 Transcript_26872/m.30206 type:complete len:153 (+) Transcript_26872:49-507(+)
MCYVYLLVVAVFTVVVMVIFVAFRFVVLYFVFHPSSHPQRYLMNRNVVITYVQIEYFWIHVINTTTGRNTCVCEVDTVTVGDVTATNRDRYESKKDRHRHWERYFGSTGKLTSWDEKRRKVTGKSYVFGDWVEPDRKVTLFRFVREGVSLCW